jgi:hypothetical protein
LFCRDGFHRPSPEVTLAFSSSSMVL